ncbi:MAG: protein phosphatase 2C domain-containing protein [Pseudomonadales bacterium]|nr:protein phosphatase 2C domain-containing protein [Pseudomonadales bacterium]NRA15020.1 serine/threonine-protein phosphatase [Oceanospirillaceae bacterium]
MYQYSASTDKGTVYQTNQDALDFDRKHCCFVVADGVGGYQSGEVASAFAVQQLMQQQAGLAEAGLTGKQAESALSAILQATNRRLINIAAGQQLSMGTTVVTGIIRQRTLHYTHVGDSRLYLLRKGLLAQLTRDDSLKEQMLDLVAGDLAAVEQHVPSNIVTQAMGLTDPLVVNYGRCELRCGDLLLCSTDGLHDVLEHSQLEQALKSINHLPSGARHLVDLALNNGSRDNISALLIRVSMHWYERLIEKLRRY